MRLRVASRIASDLARSGEAVQEARTEASRAHARLVRVQRGWQDGVLDDDDYRQQRHQLRAELDAAHSAVLRAERHAEAVERQGTMADAEGVLLAQLAAVKAAVAEGAGQAPDVLALRNAIGQLFESVELVRFGSAWPFGSGKLGEGYVTGVRPNAVVDEKTGPTYALVPRVRRSSVDFGSDSPTGQLTPVPPRPQ
jgi:hypothetical protein